MVLLGVDTGGTFTDFVLYRNGQLTTHKVLSTPHAPEAAILQGIDDLGLGKPGDAEFYLVHGSTVATNAVLEGKGVKCAYITNHGLKDVLSIGRQTRRHLYRLQQAPVSPPISEECCFETGGRLAANGEVVDVLEEIELEQLVQAVMAIEPRAVAINLLFSYLDERFEKMIEAAFPGDIFISRSSAILPEYREYERGITTWLNAYVGPLVEGYLGRLQQGVPEAHISVMQSSAGTIAAEQVAPQAVHMLLSGPAGGLIAAKYLGDESGQSRLLTFDMGGTSTDVALIDGELQLTSEGEIAGYPVAVSMVDMHTIGAGGGSIATVDGGGLLQVGPESAGAAPGPACYARGGTRATVSDANLILGRLRSDAFLGGGMQLDEAAARQAMQDIAATLGLSVEAAAEGVIRIANEHMAQALRVMSVERGIDPRGLSLVSFGGAGGLHVCALAEALDMHQALVPVHAGVLSALGMIVAPRSRQVSRTHSGLLESMDEKNLQMIFLQLEQQGRTELVAEGVRPEDIQVECSFDLRYQGQSYTLNLLHQTTSALSEGFHRKHQERYGHRLDLPIEVVNVRVALKSPVGRVRLTHRGNSANNSPLPIQLYGVGEARLIQRQELASGERLRGPALIVETISTTYLAPGWSCRVDKAGNLCLHR